MARTNRYTCKLCGTVFERCIKCMVAKPNFDAENFCEKEHADIYAILAKHGCNLITADEVLVELSAYNIDTITLAEGVAAHVARIKSEAVVQTEIPVITEEKKSVVHPKKKNKKKW